MSFIQDSTDKDNRNCNQDARIGVNEGRRNSARMNEGRSNQWTNDYVPPSRDADASPFNAFQFSKDQLPPEQTHPPQTSSEEATAESAALERTHDICSAYLRGQLSNVAKAAVWWSTFGVVAEALTEIPLAVGATRLVFNLALVVVSPIAGTMSENANIRTLLNVTTVGRLAIWCFLVPVAWLFLVVHLETPLAFFVCFLILMFLDGIQVSFANVVDIDCGGLDTLARQYKLTVGNYLRDRFNRIHQIVFDLSFILLTPPVALLLWFIATHLASPHVASASLFEFPVGKDWEKAAPISLAAFVAPVSSKIDVAVLVVGICSVFGLLSLYSLWSYWGDLSQLPPPPTEEDDEQSTSTQSTSLHLALSRFRDVRDGFLIVLKEKPLGWRLMFLAFETALEDAIVSVVIPQLAFQMTPLLWATLFPQSPTIDPLAATSRYSLPAALPGGWTLVNLVAVCLIAIGKTGGLASSSYMSTRWIAPATIAKSGAYMTLFKCMFYSCASLLALPLAYYILLDPSFFNSSLGSFCSLRTIEIIRAVSASGLVASAGFLFFVFSTAPKIGFATLLHGLVVQRDIDPKVFGFVGTFVTITDAAVILILNLVFALCGPSHFLLALSVSSGLYLLHGIAELVLGPLLILDPVSSPTSPTSDVDFPNLFRLDQPESPRNFDMMENRSGVPLGPVVESSARDLPPQWIHYDPTSVLEPMAPNGLGHDDLSQQFDQSHNGASSSGNRQVGSWAT